MRSPPAFAQYIGIDYSGAETPTSSLEGLRVYLASRDGLPVEVPPPPGPRRYWTRRGVAEWLVEQLSKDRPTLVGIDHAFSFPLEYFEVHGLEMNWQAFLDDFQRNWPTDGNSATVASVRNGNARSGKSDWRRLTEKRGRAKSVFHFGVPGVAHSTHAGLPWLNRIRRQLRQRAHFWPFDGWRIPAGRSAVVEVYPALWSALYAPRLHRTDDQHDAFCVAAWLARADQGGTLDDALNPDLSADEKDRAEVEGWILGVSSLRAGDQ